MAIPESHADLAECPPVAALSTVLPSGYPMYPVEQEARETRVIVRIHARRITLDAIHA